MLKQKLPIALLVCAVALGAWWLGRSGASSQASKAVRMSASGGMPIVMPTTGGRLEVSSVTVQERFSREDVKRFLGRQWPELGTTKSHLQLRTVYRYHVEMEKAWPIGRQDGAWVVRAGSVKPTLPVAFDTRDLEHFTDRGWARLNGTENSMELLRSISPQLEIRSQSPAYQQLAAHAGRKVLAEFVRTWLIKEKHATDPATARVIVLYPGEEVGQQE